MSSNNIKAIIFDLGGVILNVDIPRTALAIGKLCKRENDEIFKSPEFRKIFDIVEAHATTAQEIREGYFKHFNFRVTESEFDRAYNLLLLDYKQERFELLKKLKAKLPLFLLSNTNAIHRDHFEAKHKATFNGVELKDLFNKVYYSFELADAKPNESIYRTVLADAGLEANSTLFIDDNLANIEGAKKVGLICHHLKLAEGEELTELEILKEILGSQASVPARLD